MRRGASLVEQIIEGRAVILEILVDQLVLFEFRLLIGEVAARGGPGKVQPIRAVAFGRRAS